MTHSECVQVLKGKLDTSSFDRLNTIRIYKLEHVLKELLHQEDSYQSKRDYVINFLKLINLNLDYINYYDINLFKYLKFEVLDTRLFYDKLQFKQSFFSSLFGKEKKVLVYQDTWEDWSLYRHFFTLNNDNWEEASFERIDKLKELNTKYKDKKIKKIISITEKVHHHITDNEKVKVTKLEQFHTYYSDNFINLLDDYTYQLEKDTQSIIDSNIHYNQSIKDENDKYLNKVKTFVGLFGNFSYTDNLDIQIDRYNRMLRDIQMGQLRTTSYNGESIKIQDLYKNRTCNIAFQDYDEIGKAMNSPSEEDISKVTRNINYEEIRFINKGDYNVHRSLIPHLHDHFSLIYIDDLLNQAYFKVIVNDLPLYVCLRRDTNSNFLYLIKKKYVPFTEKDSRLREIDIKVNYHIDKELSELINEYREKIDNFIEDNLKPRVDNVLRSNLIAAMKDEVTDI